MFYVVEKRIAQKLKKKHGAGPNLLKFFKINTFITLYRYLFPCIFSVVIFNISLLD